MKIVFLGTPRFAEIVLEYLINSRHKVIAVVCQPDKPNARGNKMIECSAKTFAIKNSIPVYQFEKIKIDGISTLRELSPDIIVTAAYGQILNAEVLSIPKYGVINVHGSLLPKYRGASPIQYCLLKGEKETGITIMKTEVGMDDGDIILAQNMTIAPEDNSETLSEKLAHLGGRLVVDALNLIEDGKATYTPQNHDDATFTKMLKKENSYINFNISAKRCENKVRAYNPNPVAKMRIDGQEYKVYSAKAHENEIQGQNGEIVESSAKKGLFIKCEEGVLEILELSAPSSKRMSAKSYLNGKHIETGKIVK